MEIRPEDEVQMELPKTPQARLDLMIHLGKDCSCCKKHLPLVVELTEGTRQVYLCQTCLTLAKKIQITEAVRDKWKDNLPVPKNRKQKRQQDQAVAREVNRIIREVSS